MEPLIPFSIVLDPPADPRINMELDEKLAVAVRAGTAPATLRLYRWNQPAISLGRRQSPDDLPPSLLKEELPMVHRPTGGGAVLHRLDELTYAFCASHLDLPSHLPFREISSLLHRSLRQVIVDQGWIAGEDLETAQKNPSGSAPLCFSAPACGDLLYRGKKVAGAALRVWREGILLQGSIQGLPVESQRLIQAIVLVSQSFSGISLRG